MQWLSLLLIIPVAALLIILRGVRPNDGAQDVDLKDDAQYRNYLIELACMSGGRRSLRAINIVKTTTAALRKNRVLINRLLDAANLPLNLIRDEANRQKVALWRGFLLPKDGLFPLLHCAVTRGDGAVDGRALSQVIEIYCTERQLTTREVSLMRDMLGAALIRYIAQNPPISSLYNACVTLSRLDNWWTPPKDTYIDAGFEPLNHLRKFPRVLAINKTILTDRGRDFCEVTADGQSIFDTDSVSISPYAIRYIKRGGSVAAQTTCTADPVDGYPLLLCELTLNDNDGRGRVIEIAVSKGKDLYVKINGNTRALGEGGRFRLWVNGSIKMEIAAAPHGFDGRGSLILASMLYSPDDRVNSLLSRILYDTSDIALEVSGSKGLNSLAENLYIFKAAREFADFEITLIYHERNNSRIKYGRHISAAISAAGLTNLKTFNTAQAKFEGKLYDPAAPNSIIRLLNIGQSTPYPYIFASTIHQTTLTITTPDPKLNQKLTNYISHCLYQAKAAAGLEDGIAAHMAACFVLPYTGGNLAELIAVFCSLQNQDGSIDGADGSAALLAGLAALCPQALNRAVSYKDGSAGTVLEHALRAIEHCHNGGLAFPIMYNFLERLMPAIKNDKITSRCRAMLSAKNPQAPDPGHPGISLFIFISKVLGLELLPSAVRFIPRLPLAWDGCDITIGGCLYRMVRSGDNITRIVSDGREYVTDTVSNSQKGTITVKF